MASGSSVKEVVADSETKLHDLEEIELEDENENLIIGNEYFDISENWVPSDLAFKQADKDIEEYDLNFDFINAEDLYLEDPLNSTSSWVE